MSVSDGERIMETQNSIDELEAALRDIQANIQSIVNLIAANEQNGIGLTLMAVNNYATDAIARLSAILGE
jgi:phosphotransferase system HPr-like phosphotransfer protein